MHVFISRRNRRLLGATSILTSIAIAVSLLTPTVADAAPLGLIDHVKPVPGHSAAAHTKAKAPRSSTSAAPPQKALRSGNYKVSVTPGSATTNTRLPLGARSKQSASVKGKWTPVGTSGLSAAVAADPATPAAPADLDVTLLSAKESKALGLNGPSIRVTRHSDSTIRNRIALRIPRALLDSQFGADYSSRVRWVEAPATTSDGQVTDSASLAQTVDTDSLVVSPLLAAKSVVLTATASPVSTSGTGSFTATPLNPAQSWDVSAQTGDFSWSYTMSALPSAAGPSPSLSLDYSSQAIDGETGSSNNQPSAVGDGWNLGATGYIERDYVSCSLDDGASGAVATSGDLCWKTDNATLSLGGSSTTLVKATDGTWKPVSDDGSRIQHLTGTSVCKSNGTYDTDCWLLTTRDGTKYYFGLNQLPGWATGKPTTNSTWTVPVYGNDTGEPCHASTFATSSCVQAWRWNLDYVVDVHKNAEAFYYDAEANKYQKGGTTATSYIRGGQLDHIDYGFVDGQAYATNAASEKILFGYDAYGRCSDAAHTNCTAEAITAAATGPAHPTYYPDVPWDQFCAASATSCAGMLSPTFFTDGMLATVTTQVFSGSAYTKVDVWTLSHSFPAPGDGTNAALWLTKVVHTGYTGSTSLTENPTVFGGGAMQNRVWVVDGLAPLDKYRVTSITSPLGAVTSVTYSAQQCTPAGAAAIEASPETNTSRCFPQWWVPQIQPAQPAKQDLFHKYVVTSVIDDPKTGGGYDRPQETDYVYTGTPGWRYDTSPFTPTKQRTWNQYAGYSSVEVRLGDHNTPSSQQVTDYTFYRGLDGDRATSTGGTKTVYVTGSVKDSRWFAGQVYESTTLNGVGGATLSDTVNTPWGSPVTATDGTNSARYTGDGTTVVTEPLSTGSSRTVTTATTHEDATGLVTQTQQSHSDTGTSTCTTTTYAPQNTTVWLIGLTQETRTIATTCAGLSGAVYPRDAISDTQTAYDGLAVGAVPTAGAPTTTKIVDSYSGATADTAHWVVQSTSAYDSAGRPSSGTDILGHTTSVAYTPAATATTVRPLTGVQTTNTLGWVTKATFDPARGSETAYTDQNNGLTSATYDALGRRTAVWLPIRPKTANPSSPSMSYAYSVSTTAASSIATTRLTPSGALTSYTLYDGLARPVQDQAPAEGSGTTVSDTAYDAAGRVSMTAGPYWTTSVNPSTALFVPASLAQIASLTNTTYDGGGRVAQQQLMSSGSERSHTDYAYLGADRVDIVPPSGGTPTSTFTNSLGQKTKLTQYLAATISGAGQSTTYGYDPSGRMNAMTDPAGNAWIWGFDVLGNQIRSVDPDTGTTTSTYDDNGDLLTTTDARGTTLAYTYDALSRKTAEYSGAADATGKLLATWTYDTLAKGQPTASTSYVGSTPGTPGLAFADTVTGYDASYNPTGETLTIPTGAAAFAGTSYTKSYYYYPDGTLNAAMLPAEGGIAAESIQYYYDGIGNVSSVGGLISYASSVFDATGHLARTQSISSQALYNDYGYDLATGLTSEARSYRLAGTTNTVLADRTYTRDNAGNITKAITTSDTTATDTQCYAYDQLAELTTAWTPTSGDCTATASAGALAGPAPYLEQYTYDTNTGNRKTVKTVNGAISTTATYSYPAAGAAHPHAVTSVATTGTTSGTSTYGYDAAGDTNARPGQTLTYDPHGKLASLTTGAGTQSNVYDASGVLLLRTDQTGSTLFLGETELHVAAGSSQVSAVRTYTLAGKPIAERSTQPGVSGSTVSWLSTDVDGTADVQIDSTTGAATRRFVDPFGTTRGTAVPWASGHGFLNGPTDAASGLTQLGARVYDSALGRFLTADPVLAASNPQQVNGYSYSANNPITYADPTGAICANAEGAINVSHNTCGGANHTSSAAPSAAGSSKGSSPSTSAAGNTGLKTKKKTSSAYDDYTQSLVQPTGDYHGSWDNYGSAYGDSGAGHVGLGVLLIAVSVALLFVPGAEEADLVTVPAALAEFGVDVTEGAEIATAAAEASEVGEVGAIGAESEEASTAGNLAKAACGGESFSSSTPVRLATGAAVAIATIEVGDQVLATDPATGATTAKTVQKVWVNHDTDLMDVTVTANGRSSTIHTTAQHPFWDDTHRAWTTAADLRPGDRLRTSNGTNTTVSSTTTVGGAADMWDLTVADYHDFYAVTANHDVLVHNCPVGESAEEGASVHGNSASSPDKSFLYRLYDNDGNYLKTGISKNPGSRYTRGFMEDKYMDLLTSGSRREMLNLERFIVERDPGPLNHEPWVGNFSWDVP